MLPRNLRRVLKQAAPSIQVSPLLAELAKADSAAALKRLGTSAEGLPEDEAERRRAEYGPNAIRATRSGGSVGFVGPARGSAGGAGAARR
jgi:hypothetical protein